MPRFWEMSASDRYRKKLKRFFFSGFSGIPQAALAI
jgi:hypothetical protein